MARKPPQPDILPGLPDALGKVPPKAREYEGITLDEAIRKAHAIVDAAIEKYEPAYIALAYSGGEDSVVLAHLMHDRADVVVHINTGIAVPDTARHVRAVCAAWGRELIEERPAAAYEDLVLGNVLTQDGRPVWRGFPGPAGHAMMYQRLKERALRDVRRTLVGRSGRRQGKPGEILQLAGMRWAESDRRFRNANEMDKEGAVVWVSPLVWWTNAHMREYRARYRCQAPHDHAAHRLCFPGALPLNEVTQHLHMSGDCLCGAFAREGEIHGLELFYPELARRLHELEDAALAQGDIPSERCRWGWGASGREAPTQAGRLCSRCRAPEPVSEDQMTLDF